MHGTRHKGRVLDHIGKADELGRAHALAIGGELGGIDDRLGRHEHRIHIDASAQGGNVHAGAHAARLSKRTRNAADETAVGVSDALVDERRITAEVIDAKGFGGAVEGIREGHKIFIGARRRDLGDRGHRNALVHDGDTVLTLKALCRFDKMLRRAGNVVVHLGAHAIQILVGAAHERYAHGDRANVQIVL